MKATNLLFSLPLFLLFAACTPSAVAQTPTPSTMETSVRSVVTAFAKAIELQDVAVLDQLLHPEFRAVVPRYPKPEVTATLSKDVYTGMISSKKIGGTAYEVDITFVNIDGYNATAVAIFQGEKSSLHVTLLLTESQDGTWQIVSDLARIVPKA